MANSRYGESINRKNRTAMRLILVALLIITVAQSAQARESHSLLCGSRHSMAEANRAVANGDVEWLKSLPDCILVKAGTKIREIECESGVCQVRVWAPNGLSAIAYTSARGF
jgi:hypothetical protein